MTCKLVKASTSASDCGLFSHAWDGRNSS